MLTRINAWLSAAGQTLFDTPNSGEGGWPGQEAWVTPPDCLAVGYQLPVVLSGPTPLFGLHTARTDNHENAVGVDIPLAASLRTASRRTLLARLDPGPGLDTAAIEREASQIRPPLRSNHIVRRVMTTPQYQVV